MVIRRPRQTFREFLNKRLANSVVESLNELMEQAMSRLFSLMLFHILLVNPVPKAMERARLSPTKEETCALYFDTFHGIPNCKSFHIAP